MDCGLGIIIVTHASILFPNLYSHRRFRREFLEFMFIWRFRTDRDEGSVSSSTGHEEVKLPMIFLPQRRDGVRKAWPNW